MQGSCFTGAIPRMEAKREQLKIASRVDEIESVMLNLRHARLLEQRGVDLASVDARVILTSTMNDERCEEWFPERELGLAKRVGADAVIPFDRPVYNTDHRSKRLETIQVYLADLKEFAPQFRESGIDVIPLVKGATSYERGLCYEVFDERGWSRVAFYCVQYFSYGYRYQPLLARVHCIASEYNPDDMMLIGFQSENKLSDFPPSVTGAAGQRWRRKIDLRGASLPVAVHRYKRWNAELSSALSISQQPLSAFDNMKGWA